MDLNSIDENLGKRLKTEKARRRSYAVKLVIVSVVLIAAIIVVVFL